MIQGRYLGAVDFLPSFHESAIVMTWVVLMPTNGNIDYYVLFFDKFKSGH